MLTPETENFNNYDASILHRSITKLYIENFRNYPLLDLSLTSSSVMIMGHNGAGKTSILEAISMLAPGRGLKSSTNDDLKHNQIGNWVVAATISQAEKDNIRLGTTIIHHKNKEKRIIKVNGEIVRTAGELANYLSMNWLTPQLEQSLLQSSSNRRKLLDRIVYDFEIIHADNVLLYEKKVKERLQILKMPRIDERWLDIIEQDLAQLNYHIMIARIKIIEIINNTIEALDIPFPKLILKLECKLLELLDINAIANQLKNNRKIDQLSGRTNFGAHRTDLLIYHRSLNRLISYCSTGEQKSMVLSLIIFQSFAKKNRDGIAPIMLLDEVMTHLDEDRQDQLLATLKELNTQIWITSVENNFWNKINFPSQFLEVKNASIITKNDVAYS